jgi:hypothetical protein
MENKYENIVIKKWKPVLEWYSEKVPPLSIEKYFKVADKMEQMESKYMSKFGFDVDDCTPENVTKLHNDPEFLNKSAALKRLIPQIRKNEGDVETVIINDELHYVIDQFEEKWAINPDNYSEIHSFTKGNHPMGYVLSINGEWVKLTKVGEFNK